MKARSIYTFFLLPLFLVLVCGNLNHAAAQTNELKPSTLEVNRAFFGIWREVQDPNHLVEIYKEGDFVIVLRHSDRKDGSVSQKYTVTAQKGNRLTLDFGFGSIPMTISDDGTKISFVGQEYVKK